LLDIQKSSQIEVTFVLEGSFLHTLAVNLFAFSIRGSFDAVLLMVLRFCSIAVTRAVLQLRFSLGDGNLSVLRKYVVWIYS